MSSPLPIKTSRYILVLLLLVSRICWAQAPTQAQQLQRKEDSLTNLLKKEQPDSSKMAILLNLIALYQDVQPQKTSPWINEGILLTTDSKNHDKLLAFHIANMRLNNRLGQFSISLAMADKAEPLLQKAVQPNTAAAFYMQKAISLYKMGGYDKAATAYNQAAAIGRQHQLPSIEVKAIMNLAIMYEGLQRYADMRSQLTAALKIAEKAKLEEDRVNIIFNLSFLESRTNNYGKAIDYLLEVLPYFQAKGNQVVVGLCYANLSWGYYQVKRYKEALDNAQKSYAIRLAQHDQAGLSKIHVNLGQIYLETGQYDSSVSHLKKGLELARQMHIMLNLKDGYETLAAVYARQKMYKEAYENLQLHNEWKDSTYQVEKDKQLLQQLNIYKFQYGDSILLVKDGTIQQQASTNKQLWIGFHILLLAALLLCLLWFKNWKQKRKLLAEQAADKTLAKMPTDRLANSQAFDELLAEKNMLIKTVLELKTDVAALETSLKQQTRADLESLRELVGNGKLQTEGYWNEFLLLFSNVYPSFFEKLKTQHPQLTQNELRICALMKLNLSLLEISNALNITAESVRKARYRLYKKIGLNSDQELVELMITL
jgi:tetratricopeptide (TPR) repeat protein/DNA-binding CsgD family transcriptional regulator